MMQKMVIENSKILSLDPIISSPKNIFFVNKIIQFYHQIHIFIMKVFIMKEVFLVTNLVLWKNIF